MIAGAVVALFVMSGAGGQGPDGAGPRVETLRVGVDAIAPDTTRPRRKAVRVSEAYQFRNKVHKLSSFAMLPLFAVEYAAGDQLIKKGRRESGWAGDYHGFGAGVIAGLFGINTLTGGLNWWESRNQVDGRAWRTVHSALMLLSDAGFLATAALAGDEGGSGNQRNQHRAMAIGSMSVATASYLMMLKPLRRD